MLVVELLLVLAVFPLPSVVAAFADLTKHVVLGGTQARFVALPVPGHAGISAPFVVLAVLLPLAGPGLALFLLVRSGEGIASIGLGRPERPLDDLGRILPVFIAAELLPMLAGALLLAAAGTRSFPTSATSGLPTWYVAVLVLSGVVAGVTEEIVVLGYLVRRLEQLGLRPAWVVTIAVAVRLSYHAYYGPGVLPIALWATMSVVLYRHYRRLPAFIAVHAIWDGSLFAAAFLGNAVLPLVALTVGVASVVLWAMHRGQLAAEQRAGEQPPWPSGPAPGHPRPSPGSPRPIGPAGPIGPAPGWWADPAGPGASSGWWGHTPASPGQSGAAPGRSEPPAVPQPAPRAGTDPPPHDATHR